MGKHTPLFEAHKSLGAQLVDFGGWEMPVYYTSIINEHLSTRSHAGLFDICHMGEFAVEGTDAEALLQKVVSRDISRQAAGKMSLAVLCNEQGGVLDDLTVYKLEEEKFMVVVNAGTQGKDFEWIKKALKQGNFKAKLRSLSPITAKLDIQGPHAQAVLQKMVSFDLDGIQFYRFKEEKKCLNGLDALVSRSGYTGEDGFELYFGRKKAVLVWNKLLEGGKEFGLVPVGLGARDTLRLEAAFNLYGNEMDETVTPFECRYDWVVSLEKDFIGRKALLRQKEKGVQRKLGGFEMVDKAIARHGCRVFKNGKEVGHVTSGSYSPTLKKNIGLCIIQSAFAGIGTEMEVEVREKKYRAKMVALPFYNKNLASEIKLK